MVVEVSLDQGRMRVKRELEAGSSQWWKLALPCALTVQSGINRPRYAGVKGIMAAKKRPVQKVPFAEAHATAPSASMICETMAAPATRKNTMLLSGAVPEVAAQLAERLRAALSH
jgi:electron transfer flavoprotein beta subunit